MNCRICDNSENNKSYKIKEMMLGTEQTFNYFQCSVCECLQIESCPENINTFYPTDYYSYKTPSHENYVIKFIKSKRNYFSVFNKELLGRILFGYFPNVELRALSNVALDKDSKILDVGCGAGLILRNLKELGFRNLYGIDPYIEKNIYYNDQLLVEKKRFEEITDEYDLIMFHHSLEHIWEQERTFEHLNKVLAENGRIIIRIPTVSSWAWKNFKVNWVQIDAPRHFYIHSLKSLEIISSRFGLILDKVIYDSNAFQFWGSLQYEKGIPLNSPRSYSVNKEKSIFSRKDILNFEKKSKELNKKMQGDQAIFILRRKN